MQQQIEQKIDHLVKELSHLFDEKLISVCVYGSALFPEQLSTIHSKHQDINIIVILNQIDRVTLEKASSIVKWWRKEANALPLFFSEAEWERSADVFAIEYLDIRDNHRVVYGKDVYSTIQVEPADLRLVCESELNEKLIFLRQQYLLNLDHPKVLAKLLQQSVNSIAALYRAVLRIQNPGAAVSQNPKQIFSTLTDRIPEFEAQPFLRVLESKEHGGKLRDAEVVSLYNQYISEMSRVTAYVDDCLKPVYAT